MIGRRPDAHSPDRQTFRPPLALRVTLAFFGAFSCFAAVAALYSGIAQRSGRLFGAAGILCIPGVLALASARRRVEAGPDGLRSQSALGHRIVSWEDVGRIDRTRNSFTIETAQGPVSAGWLAAADRERLLQLTIERAKLALSA